MTSKAPSRRRATKEVQSPSSIEEAQRDSAAVRAQGIERATHHLGVGTGSPRSRLRPRRDGALLDHLPDDDDELQRLRREIVASAGASPEALHDLVERAEAHAQGPARVVSLRQLGQRRGLPRPQREGASRRAAPACPGRTRGRAGRCFVCTSLRICPSSWTTMTPPRGRVGSRSGVARGCQRRTNRIQSCVVQPSKRTSAVSTEAA